MMTQGFMEWPFCAVTTAEWGVFCWPWSLPLLWWLLRAQPTKVLVSIASKLQGNICYYRFKWFVFRVARSIVPRLNKNTTLRESVVRKYLLLVWSRTLSVAYKNSVATSAGIYTTRFYSAVTGPTIDCSIWICTALSVMTPTIRIPVALTSC